MKNKFSDRMSNIWNAFLNRDPTRYDSETSNIYGGGSWGSGYPGRAKFSPSNERTITNSIYNRIAIDVATISIKHVRLDDGGRYIETINSTLNERLSLDANKDQASRVFFQDLVMTIIDEGCAAILPIDSDTDIDENNTYKIYSMRVGSVLEWYPDHVRVSVYNDRTGKKNELIVPKSKTVLVQNPLYSVINEPNSTMRRLVSKLNLLDVIDKNSNSDKLNMIVQLPYSIKSQALRDRANDRVSSLEDQLTNSQYGIGYIDSTEKVTQLTRPLENNLLAQVEYLTSMLYSQLGMTNEVLNGSANEQTMLNYYSRTIEPFISAITDEIKIKFLTKTARAQHQSIMFFRDPFKLVPVNEIAEMADKFTRNEIMSSNEIRQVVGLMPSSDPSADELRNKNLSQSKAAIAEKQNQQLNQPNKEEKQNE